MLTDYLTVKQELADLEAQAKRLGPILEQIGRSLSNPHTSGAMMDNEELVTDKIRNLIRDINHAQNRKQALQQQINSLGLKIE